MINFCNINLWLHRLTVPVQLQSHGGTYLIEAIFQSHLFKLINEFYIYYFDSIRFEVMCLWISLFRKGTCVYTLAPCFTMLSRSAFQIWTCTLLMHWRPSKAVFVISILTNSISDILRFQQPAVIVARMPWRKSKTFLWNFWKEWLY